MNKNIIIFLSGMVSGTIIEMFFIKRYLESESFKITYSKMIDEKLNNCINDVIIEKSHHMEHCECFTRNENDASDINNKTNYNDWEEFIEKYSSEDKPYIITPEEFGENEEYDTISLTLYSDGILADDADKPIDDVDEVIGKGSLEHFGEYEDDSIFVRNDKLKCDYEVLIDERRYAQILEDKPYLKEG